MSTGDADSIDTGSNLHSSTGGSRPVDPTGEPIPFDPGAIEGVLSQAGSRASALSGVIDERTVDVATGIDEDAFFTSNGEPTLTTRYDLEKAVPMEKKRHFEEVERYWVNEPYAFVIFFHSRTENETKYYVVEPYLTPIEADLEEFLTGKLRTAIKYADEVGVEGSEADREAVIERETRRLLERYDLLERPGTGLVDRLRSLFGRGEVPDPSPVDPVRPEPAILAEDPETVTEVQITELLYYLKRDFVGYERIDPIKHDINVEDISCDGYDSPVFSITPTTSRSLRTSATARTVSTTSWSSSPTLGQGD